MQYQQFFDHRGQSFTVEADDWPSEEAASTAMIDLQIWAMQFDVEQTVELHRALMREATALVHETFYDRDLPPLGAVRDAQRRAAQIGLQVHGAEGFQPTITIEAGYGSAA